MHWRERMRQQSALDFLSTYSFMFLIIAIALAILLIYSTLPNNVFPLNCNMYNTFLCVDAILTNTTVAGQSQLLVVFADQVPGIINVSSFQPTLDYKAASNSICTPSIAQSGQRIYCVATFDSGAVPGRIYSGTLKLYSNYCANAAGNTTYTGCPAGSNYSYGGFIRIEASTLPKNELPLSASNFSITVNNTQNSGAIPAHFDVPISFSPKNPALATHERPDLGNIRFYYGSKELYSWCESNCSTSATGNAIFWVKIPQAIPPLSSKRNVMTLQMYLLPITTEYDGIYAGEAPQLSPSYAEYDNGAMVFNNYWNFAGTTLPSGWQGSGYTVNDGLTINNANGDYAVTTSSTYGLNPNQILDFYGTYSANENAHNAWFGYTTLDGDTNFVAWDINDYSGVCGTSTPLVPYSQIGGTGQTPYLCSGALSVPQTGVFSVYWASSSSGGYYFNYAFKGNYSSYPSSQLSIGGYNLDGQEAIGPFYWLRTRAYPPNGVMPTVTIT